MTSTDNLIAFNKYLEENHKRNRTADEARFTKLQKLGEDFDPLLDQELPTDTIVSLNPDHPTERVNVLVTHSVVRAKTKKPSLHNDNDNAAKTAKASSSEIGKAKAKAGHDTEMEIITQTRTGIRLTCRNGRVWIYTGRRDRGFTNCSHCKSSVKLPKSKSKSKSKQEPTKKQ